MKTFVPYVRFVIAAILFLGQSVAAQTTALEFTSGAGNPTGNGATLTNQVITFQTNTNNPSGNTFAPYAPALTATFSLSNQQYSISTVNISTGKGLSFGADQNNSSSTAPSFALFPQMSAISSPSNSNFTSSTTVTAGTGIDISANRVVAVFTSARALRDNGDPSTSGRYYFGDLTITFNQTVTNPIIHVVGLGGYYSDLGFSSELELQTAGVSLSKLSGSTELSVSSGTKILNTAANPSSATGSGAASGSVLATGSNLSSLTFKIYMRGDGGESHWSGSSNHQGDVWLIGISMNPPVSISGNVYNDLDGLMDSKVDGTGTGLPGGTQVYANLLNSSGNVMTTVAVNSDGTYTFNRVASSTTYTVQLSSNQGTAGQSAPTTALPSGWSNTGEFLGSGNGNDGTVDGKLAVAVSTTNVTNANFGIERTPDSDTKFYGIAQPAVNSSLTLNGAGLVPGALSGSDAEDGTLGAAKRVAITSLPTNGNQLWYNGTQVTLGADGVNPPSAANPFVIASYTTSLLSIKFTGVGSKTTAFTYAFYDAARFADPSPATYTITWGVPLPVKLVSFTAVVENKSVNLEWTTVTEINASHFVVERSTDGSNFIAAGSVEAAGNSTIRREYRFEDGIQANPSGVYYYRLHEVDLDGKSDYSAVRVVKMVSANGFAVTAFPNPVSSQLHITIPAEWQNKQVVYELINANGQAMKRVEAKSGSQTETLTVSSLPTGYYVVRVTCGTESVKQAIVKN